MLFQSVVASALLVVQAAAAPAPTGPTNGQVAPLVRRDPQLLGGLIGTLTGPVEDLLGRLLPPDGKIRDTLTLSRVIAGVSKDLDAVEDLSQAYAAVLQSIVPISEPASVPEALEQAANFFATSGRALDLAETIDNVGQALLRSFSVGDLTEFTLGGYLGGTSNTNNSNPPPPTNIYPKSADDAPYDVPEAKLRGAIYIPPTFEYGRNGKQPVLLVHGTGLYGGLNYMSNMIKLLSQTDFADPVWINIPGALMDDAQVNAEYVAYGINYINSIVNCNLSVVAWSQGTIDTQWALKYWTSTRSVVNDYIALSADFDGTVEAFLICPEFPQRPCEPSILQQKTNSNFLKALHADDGDSAYVPTTSVYSIFDEIVQPQADPIASAFINDVRGVGATNNQLQSVCPGLPAGGIYTHEGVLYNPIAYALLVDALQNDGPGQTSRLDLATLCSQLITEGLSVVDVLATEGLIPVAALNILLYFPKLLEEPPIKSYAA